MKWQIQKQLQKDYAGTSDGQAHKLQMDDVNRNPVLGQFTQKLKRVHLHKQSWPCIARSRSRLLADSGLTSVSCFLWTQDQFNR